MGVARFNLYAQSWILLITRNDNPRLRNLELAMLTLHVLWHGLLLAWALPDGWARFQFLLISHAVAGVLHVQITLSHFAMEVYHGTRLQKVPPPAVVHVCDCTVVHQLCVVSTHGSLRIGARRNCARR